MRKPIKKLFTNLKISQTPDENVIVKINYNDLPDKNILEGWNLVPFDKINQESFRNDSYIK